MRHRTYASIVIGSSLLVLALSANQSPKNYQSVFVEQNPNAQNDFLELTPVTSRYEYGVHDFSDIAILDNGEMWAVGYDGQDPRRMWRSHDGGETWQRVSITSSGFTLKAIAFVDDQNGFAVGGYGTIMATRDGGANWIQLKRPTAADLECVTFIDPKVGYIAGRIGSYDRRTDTSTYGVEVLKTTDGGNTWRLSYRDRDSHAAWQLVVLSEKVAFLLVDASRVLKTDNGGKSWYEIMFKYRGPTSIAFTKDGTGWMVGEKLFYRSTDGGLVWRTPGELPLDLTMHDWWSIAFANEKIGMAVAEDCTIAITYNGGRSWAEVKSNLHEGNEIWYDRTIGFKENLRAVHLHEHWGVVLGSQRLLLITSFGKQH